jgi:hypothetical protein
LAILMICGAPTSPSMRSFITALRRKSRNGDYTAT